MESNCFYEKAFLPSLESPITKTISLLEALQRNQFSAQLLSLRNEVCAKGGGIPRLLQNLPLEPKPAWPRKEPAHTCISIRHRSLHHHRPIPPPSHAQDRSLGQDKSHQVCSIYGQEAMEMKPRGKARAQGHLAITGGTHLWGPHDVILAC